MNGQELIKLISTATFVAALQAPTARAEDRQSLGMVGDWGVVSTQDKMSDQVQISAIEDSLSNDAKLQFSCDPPRTALFVSVLTNKPLGKGDRVFTYRVDQRTAHNLYHSTYGANYVFLLSTSRETLDLLDEAAKGTRLLVRLKTWNDADIDQEFGLLNAKEVISKLQNLCRSPTPSQANTRLHQAPR